MFSRLLRHEWRALSADATLWVVAGVFTLAIGYGVWSGARWVGFQRTALAAVQAEERDRYVRLANQVAELAKGGKVSPFADPRSPSNVGRRLGPRYATMPPGPLAALAIGQSDLLPSYFRVSTDARAEVMAATEIENPLRLLVGRFDLAFVLVYLYPLLILALTYNMVSAEKEQGTLALALSQPVSLATLMTGKVVVRALLLIGIVVGVSAFALLSTGTSFGAEGVATWFTLWVAVVAAYGAFWFALAVFVSALGRASASNATIVASAWLVLVVLLPAFFNLVVNALYPVPSRVEMVQAMREASDAANSEGSKLLAAYYEDHPELAVGGAEQAMNDFNVIRVAVDDDVEQRVQPVMDRYDRQIQSQQRTIDSVRYLSPAVLMQDALNDLTGTGTPRHRHFLSQVAAFHSTWRAYFTPLVFKKATMTALDATPRFTFIEEPPSAVVIRVLGALAGLLIPALALGYFGTRRLADYPVTS